MNTQLTLFNDVAKKPSDTMVSRSGTFVDNMSLPVHRWFRYSAGFSATWVESVLRDWHIKPEQTVLDPFVGSGTVPIITDTLGIKSLGLEAHPFVARICKAKLLWASEPDKVGHFASEILKKAHNQKPDTSSYTQLIHRSFDKVTLEFLDGLKSAWFSLQDSSPESELMWLAITAILRPTSKACTAQWQYILPNKKKKNVVNPLFAFKQQVEVMKKDIRWMKRRLAESNATIIAGDARKLSYYIKPVVDAVITSPPYANNYDYADALRFEMTFWGEVTGWGDLHDAVRKYLIVSSSQHSSREKLNVQKLLESDEVQPIRDELSGVMEQLAIEREKHGGKKHYHTMVGAYCRDISRVLQQLRIVCKAGSHLCWVIGDSAPYGVYCPVDRWTSKLALAAGFKKCDFEKLRDRNTKWKNRKHRVPLKEGLLWIEG